MIVLLSVLVIIVLLLIYSFRIVYEVSLENFDFFLKIEIKFPFTKEIYNSSKPRKKSGGAEKKKQDRKIDLDTIKKLKGPVSVALSEICRLIKRHCRITGISVNTKMALEDPMENGIAYGIVSGVLNVSALILSGKCNVKKIKLEILSDFNSGEGLIFKSCGTLKVRPVPMVLNVVVNRRLVKEIKNILEILKREENENG